MTFEELRKEMQKLQSEDKMKSFERLQELRENGELLTLEGYFPAE
jgi:hypothetical protein